MPARRRFMRVFAPLYMEGAALLMNRFVALFVIVIGFSPNRGQSEPPSPGEFAVAMQKHDAGTLYVSGVIEGYGAVNLLVDTGSSHLVINETILEKLNALGRVQPAGELGGVMADGSRRVVPKYRVSGLRLGQACWIRDIEAAVFPGNARPILGMNALARVAPFTISADPPSLSVHRCMSEPLSDLTASVEASPAESLAQ